MRIGIGYDIHRLKKGRKLKLGGLEIPFAKGLLGHSDGDVLIHASVDAVLGAAGLGDIGEHFPDSDARYRGADSSLFIRGTRKLLKKHKMRLQNLDAVVLAEAPKLAPYKRRMRQRLASLWGLKVDAVNVKAKTNEGLDAVGRGEAIACYAAASVRK